MPPCAERWLEAVHINLSSSELAIKSVATYNRSYVGQVTRL
jgi:hypothetical protein